MAFGPPGHEGDFRSFWSCGTGWGNLSLSRKGGKATAKIGLIAGGLVLREFSINRGVLAGPVRRVFLNGVAVRGGFSVEETAVRFAVPVKLEAGDWLEVEY